MLKHFGLRPNVKLDISFNDPFLFSYAAAIHNHAEDAPRHVKVSGTLHVHTRTACSYASIQLTWAVFWKAKMANGQQGQGHLHPMNLELLPGLGPEMEFAAGSTTALKCESALSLAFQQNRLQMLMIGSFDEPCTWPGNIFVGSTWATTTTEEPNNISVARSLKVRLLQVKGLLAS